MGTFRDLDKDRCSQNANTIIRAIEQDCKVRELDEIEERIAELEARTETGGRRAA